MDHILPYCFLLPVTVPTTARVTRGGRVRDPVSVRRAGPARAARRRRVNDVPVCSPSCSPKAVCQQNNTCVCRPFYEGDGYTCTVLDVCATWNGGCAKGAKCSQRGETVTCSCPKGYAGDGFSCQPIDPCVAGDNGGCHQHATCTMTAPGKKKCTCKDNYVGDGVTCDVKQLPISRCLQDNGRCHQDAKCTDLHFEGSKFHEHVNG
ncbi:stabilin-2-like [Etheostoma cragini]|uniref:stabilin-2-like n=1 Tax=Etheostoma cragini TaxID=417921 RepID=UPI00155E020A|nr:stabilin-2-like [Etheostoma cragini]